MENKTGIWQLSIKDSIDIIFRHKKIMLITFAAGVFLTLAGIQFITPMYEASVSMLMRGQGVTTADELVPIRSWGIESTQAQIVQSNPVLKRAVIALGLEKRPFDYEKKYCSGLKKIYIDYVAKSTKKYLNKFPTEKHPEIKLSAAIGNLKDRLRVEILPGTDIFVINVLAFSPKEAIETANVISRSYTIFLQMQQLAEIGLRYGESHPTVIQLRDNIENATNNLSGKTLPDIEAIGTASVKIIEQATSSGHPVGKPRRIIFTAGFFISILMGFAIAFMYGLFDQTIKTSQDIVEFLNIPCIGSIPRKARKENYLITEESPLTTYTEYYEDLAEQLYVFLKTQSLNSAVITSPIFNEDHKFIVPNIGYYLSNIMGHSVLMIDANFNNPHFQKIYDIEHNDSLADNPDLETTPDGEKEQTKTDSFISHHLSQNLISKINDGPDILLTDKLMKNIHAVLKEFDLKNIIKKMKKEYDAVLIDATSLNNLKEISLISECSDGTVFIIDEGKLQRTTMKNSLPILRKKEIKIIGSILNNRTFPIPEFIYKRFKYFID